MSDLYDAIERNLKFYVLQKCILGKLCDYASQGSQVNSGEKSLVSLPGRQKLWSPASQLQLFS